MCDAVKTRLVLVVALAIVAFGTNARAIDYFDDFEGYAAGSSIVGLGDWVGWDGDMNPAMGGFVTDVYSHSGSHSLQIGGNPGLDTDVVYQFSGVNVGQHVFSAMTYVPSSATTTTHPFMLFMSGHPAPLTWSGGMEFLTGPGEVRYDGSPERTPMVRDEWVEARLEVDLDAGAASMYYGGTLLGNYAWNDTDPAFPQFAGVDLWVPVGSAPMYVDDTALTQIADLTWDNNHSQLSWGSPHWGPGGPPDEFANAILPAGNTDVVRVDADGATAYSLTVDRGGVNIMANQLLEIVRDVDFAQGTTLSLGNNATLSVGGGEVRTITAAVNPTLSVTSGTLEVGRLTATATDALTKVDGGELAVNTLQVRSSTVLHVDGGVLSLAGNNPLGGSTRPVMLGGGEIQIKAPLSTPADPGLVTTGLLAHFDAGGITGLDDGEQVTLWPDSSPAGGYDATAMGGTPRYVASVLGLNGKPAVRFSDGGNDWFEFNDVNNLRSAFLVLKDSAPGDAFQYILGDDTNYHFHAGEGGNFFDNRWVHGNVTNGTVKLDGQVIDGIQTQLPLDHSVLSIVTAGNVEVSTIAADRQGATGNCPDCTGRSWRGHMAEVLLYNVPLSAAEELQVTEHLQAKYGLGALLQLSMPEQDFIVTEDSAISAISDGPASFGTLTLRNGIITTKGEPMSFAETVIAADATAVGIDPRTETDFGGIDGSGPAGPFIFSKGGPLTLTVEPGYLTNMENATLDAREGTLTLNGAGAWAGATKAQISGGTLEIRAGDIAGGALTAGLVGAWLFDEGAGTIAVDSMGNGDGLVQGATWVNDPQRGWVLDFNAVGQVEVGAGPFATVSDAVTIAFWQNGDAATQPRNDTIFQAKIGGARALGSHVPWSNSNVYWDAGGANSCCADRSNFVIPPEDFEGRWNHYAYTKDTNTGEMKVFINGAERHSAGGRTIPLDNIDRIFIGSEEDFNYYDGMMDEFLIYDRALNAAEVSQLFNDGLQFADLPPVDMTDKELSVVDAGTLRASPSPVNLGTLTVIDGAALTTSGASVSFTDVVFDGDATVTFTSNTDTTLTAATGIDGQGQELVIEIDGGAQTIVNKVGTGLDSTTFELYGGELVGLIDASGTTFGTADLSFNGGGVLLSSTGGNQTFDVPLAIEGDGTFGAAEVPGGVAGVTLTLGSAANGVTFEGGAVFSLEASDGYTLSVDGPAIGLGGFRSTAGTVNLTGVAAKDYEGITAVSDGLMTVDAPLPNTSNIEVTGGTLVLNQPATTNGAFVPGEIIYGYYSGATAAVIAGTDDGSLNGANGGLFKLTPTRSQVWVDEVWQQGNIADNYGQMWSGVFIAPATGTYNFDVHGDDHEIFYIDLNQDGEFHGAAEHITDNVPPDGWNTPKIGTAELEAGQRYGFALAHTEGGGGDFLNFTLTPPDGAPVRANPSLQPGWWGHAVASTTRVADGTLEINAPLITGRVAVSDGGTINVNAGGSVEAGALSISSGGTMNVGADGNVTLDTLTILGGGVYDTQVPASARTLTLRGGGTVLTNGNRVTVSESLNAGNYSITVDAGGDFSVMGADLAAGIDALTLGGDVRYNGPRAPISYWTFDDGAGDIAVNSADPTLNGTLIDLGTGALPAWSTRGKIDGAVVFDGNGYVDLPDGYADFTGGITLAGWIYHLSYPDWGRIIDFGNGAGVDNVLLAHRGTTGDAQWMFYDAAGGDELIQPNGIFTTFGWQHIVATCDDGPTNGATMKLYVNGDLAFEEDGKSTPANVLRTNNYIGESNWDANAFFHGYMDELIIWDRELSAEEIGELHIAGVLGDPAPDFTQVSLGGTLDGTGTLTADLTLNGRIVPSGPDGGGSGTINFRGDVRMTGETSTVLTMDAAGMSQLANLGNSDLVLGGELQYRVEGIDAADEGKDVNVTIVTALSEGVIQGTFDVVPPGSTATPAHIEAGVFHKGLTYHDAFPPTTPPSYFSIETTLRVAQGGDANGDGRVDGQDITNLITNFSRPGDPADRNWLKSDTAGGIFGRGDGNVDGQDITDLISNFTGDAGPANDGIAAAEYNPATGEVRIFADGVMSWSLISDGEFTDTGLTALTDVLPLGDAANLASLNENTIGEGGFNGTMSYADAALGAIVPAGTDPSQLTLQYVTGFGAEPQIGAINVVPEPGTLAMLLACALGAGLIWRRRCSR